MRSKDSKETKIPDIAERMKAGWVTDKLIGDDPIKLPGSKLPESLRSKQMEEGLSIVGADVRSLFPSLQNVEAARLTRLAVLKSKVQFNDIDYHKALRYISIVGGNELIDRAGLWRVRPIWKGGRPDLITVGGDASRDETNWCDSRHDIMEHEKRMIIATAMEIGVNVAMSTHVYVFCGRLYLQWAGGPIGLRITACLAALIMKLWDIAWLTLLDREEIDLVDYFRYVDDARSFARPLIHGVRWDGMNFVFKKDWEIEDKESGKTDQQRTTAEFVKAMSSLVEYLEFEGEESSMFPNDRLPTLDCELWFDENSKSVMWSFYEKPTVPNRVIQRDTALSESSSRSSLVQEVVRRLKNCCENLPKNEIATILSKFGQKLINSGQSMRSSQYLLVHGVVKFLEMLRVSKLPKTHTDYKPIHCNREFNLYDRKLKKMLARSS